MELGQHAAVDDGLQKRRRHQRNDGEEQESGRSQSQLEPLPDQLHGKKIMERLTKKKLSDEVIVNDVMMMMMMYT